MSVQENKTVTRPELEPASLDLEYGPLIHRFFCSGKINLCYLRKVLQTFDKISLHTKQSTNVISLTEWPSYIFR